MLFRSVEERKSDEEMPYEDDESDEEMPYEDDESDEEAESGSDEEEENEESAFEVLMVHLRRPSAADECEKLIQRAKSLSSNGKPAKAKWCLEKVIELAENVGHRRFEGMASASLGQLYWRMQKNDDAIWHYSTALEIAKEEWDTPTKGSAYAGLAIAHLSKKDFDNAEKNFLKCLSVADDLDDSETQDQVYEYLANVYMSQGKHAEAIRFFRLCLKRSQELQKTKSEATFLSHLGNVYELLGRDDEALEHYLARLEIVSRVRDWEAVHQTYLKIIQVCVRLKQPANAKKVQEKADELAAYLASLASDAMQHAGSCGGN